MRLAIMATPAVMAGRPLEISFVERLAVPLHRYEPAPAAAGLDVLCTAASACNRDLPQAMLSESHTPRTAAAAQLCMRARRQSVAVEAEIDRVASSQRHSSN